MGDHNKCASVPRQLVLHEAKTIFDQASLISLDAVSEWDRATALSRLQLIFEAAQHLHELCQQVEDGSSPNGELEMAGHEVRQLAARAKLCHTCIFHKSA
jgi:hypothetical protein